jgi:lysophospholipase
MRALKSKESIFKGYDDTDIFFQVWEAPSPKGVLLITHGQAEHSDAYHRLVEGLTNSHWTIIAWDLRGHGRSGGKRGFAAKFDEYAYDLELLLKKIQPITANLPLVLLGHSMGGLVTLKTILDNQSIHYNGLVLSAPLLGLRLPVPGWKTFSAEWINRIYPEITLGNEIKFEDLTREKAIQEEYKKDALRHDRISPGVFLGFKEAMEQIKNRGAKMKHPLLMQIPTGDPICNPDISIAFFESATSDLKQLCTYEDAKHEIYNDIIREQAYADLANFLIKIEAEYAK